MPVSLFLDTAKQEFLRTNPNPNSQPNAIPNFSSNTVLQFREFSVFQSYSCFSGTLSTFTTLPYLLQLHYQGVLQKEITFHLFCHHYKQYNGLHLVTAAYKISLWKTAETECIAEFTRTPKFTFPPEVVDI